MAQNYASRFQSDVDEVFRREALTGGIVNNGIKLNFLGVNAVSVYGVSTVAEGNYVRSGTNRFGNPAELDTTKQTFTLSQDKAATWTIDKGNLQDSMSVTEAASTLRRQMEIVAIPNTDIYRLTTLQAYAVANSQTATNSGTTTTAATAFTKILDMQSKLDDLFVPTDGRIMFVTPAVLSFLKLDANFVKASELQAGKLISGQQGEVDGVAIVKVPTSYLPSKCEYLLTHKSVLISPTKLETFRMLDNVQGIDGTVVETRRYYDAFVPTNVGKGVLVSQSA